MHLASEPGQEDVFRRLVDIIGRGRLAHGFVFIGEPGVGKRATALRFAQALLCTQPEDGYPCGTCPACKRVENGTHPDLHTLAPENRVIKVEKIRELQERMGLKTYEGGSRIVIIDEAEAMNEAAANAFLKTLEEPPPGTVVLLLSSRAELLPATILSRAQPIRFRTLPWEQVRRYVSERGLSDGEQRVRLAEGRLDIAAEDDLVDFRHKVERDVHALLENDLDAKEVWAGRDDALAWMDVLFGIIRDEMVIETTRDGSLAGIPERTPCIPTAAAGDGRVRELAALGREMFELRNRFRFNLNLGVTLQLVGLRLRGSRKVA